MKPLYFLSGKMSGFFFFGYAGELYSGGNTESHVPTHAELLTKAMTDYNGCASEPPSRLVDDSLLPEDIQRNWKSSDYRCHNKY